MAAHALLFGRFDVTRAIVSARIEGSDSLGPPLIALVRPASDDETTRAFSRNLPVDVSLTPEGWLVYSTSPPSP